MGLTPAEARGARADREPPGLAARAFAVTLVTAVLHGGHTLDEALTDSGRRGSGHPLAARDRAFARLLAATVLRRAGEIEAVLATFLTKPLPRRPPELRALLLVGAAQLLFLGTPAYAAVSTSVQLCGRAPSTRRYDKLANAVLRRVGHEGADVLATLDGITLNIPAWIFARWTETHGADTARRIAEASLAEAALDLTVKSDAPGWAARLGGTLLPTGSVRLAHHGPVDALDGYDEGEWWVQDAAAALPVRLLGDVRGLAVADLCAAPGGKTAQLAAAGAAVTAVDRSAERLGRVRANLDRLKLDAEIVEADVATWAPGRAFDAVLLDVPCTATGTIRRHPDILRLRRPSDINKLGAIQGRLLDAAAARVKPGGLLVYCVCSLEPEEGPGRIAPWLERNPAFVRMPLSAGEIGAAPGWITGVGDLCTLPHYLPADDQWLAGLDGFYAVRLRRTG